MAGLIGFILGGSLCGTIGLVVGVVLGWDAKTDDLTHGKRHL